MLSDTDKRLVKMIVGAFSEAVDYTQGGPQKEVERSKPLIDYGRELLGMSENTVAARVWQGFYLGFGKGCEFMTEITELEENK